MLVSETFLFAEAGTGLAENATHSVETVMELALPLLKALSIAILMWGVVCAAMRLVVMEAKLLRGNDYKRDAGLIREHLGYYLLLALEFLIAVDIIETLMHPDWKELGVLAGLVVLRTVMGFSLNWELKEIEEKRRSDEQSTAESSTSENQQRP